MKDEQVERPKHLQDHAPTVIHNPEEDQTVLARWLMKGLEKGPLFWLPLGGLVAGVLVVGAIVGNMSSSRSESAEAWTDLILAKSSDDLVKTAEGTHGPAAGWAFLQAAEARYREAFDKLPEQRDAALPLLTSARELFQRAAEASPADSLERRTAMLGEARVLETRGNLEDALAQYKKVAEAFPSTPEGRQAKKLAGQLENPEVVSFYQKFSVFKPAEAKLPSGLPSMNLAPGGSQSFTLPGLPGGLTLPADHPSLDGPTIPAPGLGSPSGTTTPPPEAPKPEAAKPEDAPKGDAAPKADATPKAAAGADIPASPFAGESPKAP